MAGRQSERPELVKKLCKFTGTRVSESRIALCRFTGPGNAKLAAHSRTGDVIYEIYGATIGAGVQIHLKSKPRVVDHDRLGARDRTGKHLVARINQCTLGSIDPGRHVV